MAVVEQVPQEVGVMAHEGAFVGGAKELLRGAAVQLWEGVRGLGHLITDAVIDVAAYDPTPMSIPAQQDSDALQKRNG